MFKGAVIYILASTLNACGAICSLKCLEICIRAELVLPLVGSIFRFLKREHEKEKKLALVPIEMMREYNENNEIIM